MHPPVLSCIGILKSEAIGQRILLQEIVGSQEAGGQRVDDIWAAKWSP